MWIESKGTQQVDEPRPPHVRRDELARSLYRIKQQCQVARRRCTQAHLVRQDVSAKERTSELALKNRGLVSGVRDMHRGSRREMHTW